MNRERPHLDPSLLATIAALRSPQMALGAGGPPPGPPASGLAGPMGAMIGQPPMAGAGGQTIGPMVPPGPGGIPGQQGGPSMAPPGAMGAAPGMPPGPPRPPMPSQGMPPQQ